MHLAGPLGEPRRRVGSGPLECLCGRKAALAMQSRLILLAVAFGLTLPACSRKGAPPRLLTLAQPASAVSLDPHLHDEEATYSTLSHFYSRLVTFGPELEVIPELALSWESPSETIWRFRLRTGVVFHDGRPFTAEDAVATIRRGMELPGSKVAFYLQSVAEARAVAPDLLEVQTRYPYAVLLNKLALIDVVPRDAPRTPITAPVGTGPYRFVAGAPGQPIEGERFGRFFGPLPAWERVTILPFPDERERATAVSQQKADIAGRLSEDAWAAARSLPGQRLLSRDGIGVTMLGLSTRPGSPFSDVRVRRALARAIDRRELAAAWTDAPPAVPMAQLVPPGVFGHSRHFRAEGPDEAAARALLAEAGHAGGVDARLLVPDSARSLAPRLVAQLERVGIRLTVDSRPWPTFYERWSRSEFEATLFAWSAATTDVSDVLDALLHSPRDGYGGSNHFGYADPELDRLIELSNRTLDPYQRLTKVESALEIYRRDLPVVPLLVRPHMYAIRPGLDWTPRRDRRIRASDVKPEEAP